MTQSRSLKFEAKWNLDLGPAIVGLFLGTAGRGLRDGPMLVSPAVKVRNRSLRLGANVFGPRSVLVVDVSVEPSDRAASTQHTAEVSNMLVEMLPQLNASVWPKEDFDVAHVFAQLLAELNAAPYDPCAIRTVAEKDEGHWVAVEFIDERVARDSVSVAADLVFGWARLASGGEFDRQAAHMLKSFLRNKRQRILGVHPKID